MTEFTPIASGLGGAMIGLASAAMLVFNGRIAGISGILGGLIEGGEDRSWRGFFILGMILGGLGLAWIAPASVPTTSSPLWLLAVAGLLVGMGTRIGGGCTSGHGVCGISRTSKRSIVATGIFMTTATLTVYVSRHLLGLGGLS